MTTKPECTLGHKCDACNVPEMALRDWFAGMALSAMVDRVVFDQSTEDMLVSKGINVVNFEAFTAMCAYNFADAMMREREK